MPVVAGVEFPDGCPSIVGGETRGYTTNIVYVIKRENNNINPCLLCDDKGTPCCKVTYKKGDYIRYATKSAVGYVNKTL